MVLLDPDAFLTQLTRILERSRDTGTIYVTFKRCPAGAAKAASAASSDGSPVHDCLVRAVGSKQKISALITAKNYQRFMQSYGNILKVSMDSLKKREKKRLEKKGSTLVVEKQQPQRRSKGGSRPAAT